ncbi:MAG: hypothetical protein ACK40S_10875 [Burkholderiaceae bacterium]
MSLFSWFRRKSPPTQSTAGHQPAQGLLQADATVPLNPGRLPPSPTARSAEPAAGPRNERMERREMLYAVVRDVMVRASILTAGYKFKVLSLDQRGRQFLVMIDLAREYGGDTNRLSEIEVLIAQTAKARHDILVTAVYWRIHEQVAVSAPTKPLGAATPAEPGAARPANGFVRPQRPERRAAASSPAPLGPVAAMGAPSGHSAILSAPAVSAAPVSAAQPRTLAPAATESRRAPLLPPRTSTPFEPIEADEVAAFKRALADHRAQAPGRSAAGSAAAAQPGVTVRSGPLLPLPESTGFEDTEMPESEHRGPDLSSTQYGELR